MTRQEVLDWYKSSSITCHDATEQAVTTCLEEIEKGAETVEHANKIWLWFFNPKQFMSNKVSAASITAQKMRYCAKMAQ